MLYPGLLSSNVKVLDSAKSFSTKEKDILIRGKKTLLSLQISDFCSSKDKNVFKFSIKKVYFRQISLLINLMKMDFLAFFERSRSI